MKIKLLVKTTVKQGINIIGFSMVKSKITLREMKIIVKSFVINEYQAIHDEIFNGEDNWTANLIDNIFLLKTFRFENLFHDKIDIMFINL